MSLDVFFLVLLAALLHASWNALIKLGGDRLVAMALLSGSSGLIGFLLTPFVPLPAPASWPFIVATSFIHVGYFWFLARAYELGAFADVYPIARGSAPLITLLGALIFLQEVPDTLTLLGVLVLALGIMSLAFGSRGKGESEVSHAPILMAFATGGFIASYSLADGIGVRLSGTVAGYTAWVFALHGLPFMGLVAWVRRDALWPAVRSNWRKGALGGALSFAAYGIVLWAFARGALAPVAALRETSVIFAALFSALLLKEGFGFRRVLAAGLVALGMMLLAF